jgi:hypothetical protein
MRRSAVAFLVASVFVVLASSGASAQNLLVNPDFDTDVLGWSGLGIWDPLDAFGSPTSGSATWTNTWAAGGALYLVQCVELGPDFEAYDLGGYALIPSGQAGEGYTHLNVSFYSDAGCGTHISGWSTANYSGLDIWQWLTLTDWAPNGVVSARVGFLNQKTATGDFQTLHDAMFFGPNPTMIFGDGFQSSDTSEWSAVAGGME